MNKLFLNISTQEQIIFSKHLAMMIKAGMSILDSLKMLKKQARSRSMVKILDSLMTEVSNGQFLSAALEKFRNIFGDFAINIIRVGENSGVLYENLNYLALELNKSLELRKKIVGALIYPVIIVLVTFSIAGVLTIYIFPKITPVFKSLNIPLPMTTQILMGVSDFMAVNGVYLFDGLVVFIIAFWLLLKVKSVRYVWDKSLFYVPILGTMVVNYNVSNFCRTFGLLLKSDIKVVEAISITADTTANLVYKKELKEIAVAITKGEEISVHLERRSRIFPGMVSQMVAVGENTGNLSENLVYLSEFYEKEVDDAAKNLSTILEPVLMVFMGIVVGFIAISVVTPIYQVSQGLNR